ncbi:MAG: cation diffusion facilitator family transporter [Anaerolineales bacterium]
MIQGESHDANYIDFHMLYIMTEPLSATAQHSRSLKLTFALTFGYFIVEVVGGLLTNSLALLSDAGHMLTDVGGLGIALFAAWMAQKPASPSKTYGYYRVEILAALGNALALFLIAFYILYEAYRRFQAPPEVASGPMLMVAALGLGVNLFGIWNLRQGSKASLNIRGAFLEVVSDALGSLGALLAGFIMLITGWYYADPIVSVVVGILILPRTWQMMVEAVNVLLEATPAHINLAVVAQAMQSAPEVIAVHDLHVWTITSGLEALSGHVVLAEGLEPRAGQRVLETLADRLKEAFGIEHTTLQIEYTSREANEPRL